MSSAADYTEQLKKLLPPGILWDLQPTSVLSKVLQAAADELARVDTRSMLLIDESDPRTANETLENWEAMLGITPPSGTTLAQRRIAITQAYVARGGGTAAYFVQVLAAQGITATVSYYTVSRSGTMRSGDRLVGPSWLFAWKITLPNSTPNHSTLEAYMRSIAPAHTVLVFNYV